jgi:hypothetical protein
VLGSVSLMLGVVTGGARLENEFFVHCVVLHLHAIALHLQGSDVAVGNGRCALGAQRIAARVLGDGRGDTQLVIDT